MRGPVRSALAGSVQGFSSSHSVPAGWYGLTPAEIAAIDPLGIGPSRAASQYFKQYPSPNEPGRDGQNIMDYPVCGADRESISTPSSAASTIG